MSNRADSIYKGQAKAYDKPTPESFLRKSLAQVTLMQENLRRIKLLAQQRKCYMAHLQVEA